MKTRILASIKSQAMNSTLARQCTENGYKAVAIAVRAVLAVCVIGNIQATTIGIDPGRAPSLPSQATASFDQVNGVELLGQSLSLDFTLTGGKFIRLFTSTDTSFATLLTFQTNGTGLVGFLDGTGYLVDQLGNALQPPQALGSGSGDGSMSAVLFPLFLSNPQRPFDFFGVHFDLVLPTNSSVSITGGELQFVTPGIGNSDRFGIGPGVPADIVPEGGATLILLGLGLAGLFGLKSSVRPAR